MHEIKKVVTQSIESKQALLERDDILQTVAVIIDEAVKAYQSGHKILAAGNGGSAADAQHFVAEYVGRFYYDRPALPAIALTTDTSIITAIGNDYGYDEVFSRQIEANGVAGDLFFAFSTSGNSSSIIKALEAAKRKGLITIGMTGENPSLMDNLCTYLLKMPSTDTPRIQECHALIEHIICQFVEKHLYPKKKTD